MTTDARQHRTAAVLFTDLVGSTELLSRLGEAAFELDRPLGGDEGWSRVGMEAVRGEAQGRQNTEECPDPPEEAA